VWRLSLPTEISTPSELVRVIELMVLMLKMESNAQVMLALLVSNSAGWSNGGDVTHVGGDVYISCESKIVFRVGISEGRQRLKMTRM
jgi:hypothetical protein